MESNAPATSRFEAERRELEAVLASRLIGAQTSRGRILRYICEKHFAGEADQLKEYNLAVDALGRPPDFDKKRFSVVRVEAHRLRKRLQEYYATEGRDHDIHIVMSPGQYTVRFLGREEALRAEAAQAEAVQAEGVPTEEPPNGEVPPDPEGAQEGEPPSAPRSPGYWWVAAAVALGGMVLLAVVLWNRPGRPADARRQTRPAHAAGTGLAGSTIRILAGLAKGPYVDRLGRTWDADRYFSGGTVMEMPPRQVGRSVDPELYLRPRTGEFLYDIPLAPGSYELRLLFAETQFREDEMVQNGGEASRIFNVFANGRPLLEAFDLIVDAGGPNLASTRVFRDIQPASDGYLHLDFRNNALLSGIEITPGTAGRMRPIRILAARRTGYTDAEGNAWGPDQYYLGGRAAQRQAKPRGEVDPELYLAERWGTFSYAIPVDPRGIYTVKLMFCEHFWGPGGLSVYWPNHPGAKVAGIVGGVGSRTFDILGNTRLLVRELDIYREAGGRLHGISRTFRGLRPNAQGKLALSFLPVSCYATLAAIEVTEEAP